MTRADRLVPSKRARESKRERTYTRRGPCPIFLGRPRRDIRPHEVLAYAASLPVDGTRVNARRMATRARWRRLITVPLGIPSLCATSS